MKYSECLKKYGIVIKNELYIMQSSSRGYNYWKNNRTNTCRKHVPQHLILNVPMEFRYIQPVLAAAENSRGHKVCAKYGSTVHKKAVSTFFFFFFSFFSFAKFLNAK